MDKNLDGWLIKHQNAKIPIKDINNNMDRNLKESIEVIKLLGASHDFHNKITYRAEGNANIVLAINKTFQVLRFKKTSKRDDTAATQNNENDDILELRNKIDYVNILMKYFTCNFVQTPKIIHLEIDSLEHLNKYLEAARPAYRIDMEIGTKYGLLYPDVAFLPKENSEKLTRVQNHSEEYDEYCIEIKPKQGWMFDDDSFLGDTDNSINLLNVKKCRYCYLQYLKLEKNTIESISNYCPIDLFSGGAERMNNAIRGLVKNPQNNFKLFRNGELVYGENSHTKELHTVLTAIFKEINTQKKRKCLFINLLRKTLMKDFSLNCDSMADICSDYEHKHSVHSKSCIHDSQCLPQNCVLRKILDAQFLVLHNFQKMEQIINPKTDNSILEKDLFVAINNPTNNSRKALREYMVGATALDCSIMITFCKVLDNQVEDYRQNCKTKNHLITINESLFIINLTIMDLDLKSTKHYNKYKKQYSETKLAYYNFLSDNKNVLLKK